jgi:hypothetical protein
VIPAPASYIAVLGSAPLSAQRTLKAQDAKAKLEQMGLYQIKKLLHSKTIHTKEITCRMGENLCQLFI